MKMPLTFRRGLYSLVAISWITGVTFFILSTWVTIEGEFGPQKHPLQFPMLMTHAVAAFFMMMTFGALLATHVPASWRTGRLRGLGLSLLVVVGFQILSAWFLYYISNDELREWVSYFHLGAGLTLPALLGVHIVAGIRSKRVPSRNVA